MNVILSGRRPRPLFLRSLPNRCIATSDVQGQLRTLAPQQKKSFYSITSSASASKFGGSSRPIDFAVFKLTTNRYLVGSSNGKSAGLAPLRIRSTREAARSKDSLKSGP